MFSDVSQIQSRTRSESSDIVDSVVSMLPHRLTGSFRASSIVRSSFYSSDSVGHGQFPAGFNRIKADFSFDLWSLGVVLFMLCTTNPALVQSNRSDNISEEEDMEKIKNWNLNTLKQQKLGKVGNKYAKNLLSILLSSEPSSRLNTKAILNHPFITGNRATTRLRGDVPKFDVFLSYRVDSDYDHARKVYEELKRRDLNVWWDKESLPAGRNWEQGFCSGLFNSATFVCLVSREAVNSAAVERRNVTKLESNSQCDNVILEWRLAQELFDMGMLNGIYPLLIGDKDPTTSEYSDYFKSGCNPTFSTNVVVDSIEGKLREHLEREGLGFPLTDKQSIKNIFSFICNQQGFKIENNFVEAIEKAGSAIRSMVKDARDLFLTPSTAYEMERSISRKKQPQKLSSFAY